MVAVTYIPALRQVAKSKFLEQFAQAYNDQDEQQGPCLSNIGNLYSDHWLLSLIMDKETERRAAFAVTTITMFQPSPRSAKTTCRRLKELAPISFYFFPSFFPISSLWEINI